MCVACLDSRILKGNYDLSLDIEVKKERIDDLYFKDDRLFLQYTEIVGGLCGSGQNACAS